MTLVRSALVAAAVAAGGCSEPATATCDAASVERVGTYTLANFKVEAYWEWRRGLTLSGLTAAYECTGDERYLDAVLAWFDEHIDEGRDPEHVNDGAPGLALISAYRATGDPQYLEVAEGLAEYFVDDHAHIDGALEHQPEQLWVDTTYMVAPFMAELGAELDDERYTEVAIDQVLSHADKMRDAETGLWFHGWVLADGRTHGSFWGRGNGWAAATAAEVVLRMPEDHPRRTDVADELLTVVRGLAEVQHDGGGWHTLVDDPTSYVESSGTTLIAFALLVALEFDDDPVLERAYEKSRAFLRDHVAADGHLRAVSGPTALHDNPNYYKERPADEPRQFAQGNYLRLLTARR